MAASIYLYKVKLKCLEVNLVFGENQIVAVVA